MYIGKEIDALNAKSAAYYRLDEDKRHTFAYRVKKTRKFNWNFANKPSAHTCDRKRKTRGKRAWLKYPPGRRFQLPRNKAIEETVR